jgi:hypothetical protein
MQDHYSINVAKTEIQFFFCLINYSKLTGRELGYVSIHSDICTVWWWSFTWAGHRVGLFTPPTKISLHHTRIEFWFPCFPVCGPVSLNYEHNISQTGSTGLEPLGHGASVTGSSPAVGGGCQLDLPPHYIVSIIDIYCECFQQDHIPGKETQRHLVGWQEVFITIGSYISKQQYDETISFKKCESVSCEITSNLVKPICCLRFK